MLWDAVCVQGLTLRICAYGEVELEIALFSNDVVVVGREKGFEA